MQRAIRSSNSAVDATRFTSSRVAASVGTCREEMTPLAQSGGVVCELALNNIRLARKHKLSWPKTQVELALHLPGESDCHAHLVFAKPRIGQHLTRWAAPWVDATRHGAVGYGGAAHCLCAAPKEQSRRTG